MGCLGPGSLSKHVCKNLRLLWTTSKSSLYLDQALTCRRQYLSQVLCDLHFQKFWPLSIQASTHWPTIPKRALKHYLHSGRWSLIFFGRVITIPTWDNKSELDDTLLYVVKIGFLLGMIMGLPIPGWMDVWTHLCCAWGCVYDLRPVCQRDQGLHRPAGEKEEGRATNLKSIFSQVTESTLDAIVDTLANGEFCANVGEGCPEVVDFVIRWKFWRMILFWIAGNPIDWHITEIFLNLSYIGHSGKGFPCSPARMWEVTQLSRRWTSLSISTQSFLMLIDQFSFLHHKELIFRPVTARSQGPALPNYRFVNASAALKDCFPLFEWRFWSQPLLGYFFSGPHSSLGKSTVLTLWQ